MTSEIWGIIWEECQHLAVLVKITKEAWELGQFGRQGSRDVFWEHSMTFYDILPWLSNDKLS